jgi:hypothetical protein
MPHRVFQEVVLPTWTQGSTMRGGGRGMRTSGTLDVILGRLGSERRGAGRIRTGAPPMTARLPRAAFHLEAR